jgi:peptidoglycan/xylan/chitin deacetylase (PgdA/CDA1 family)
MKRRIKVLLGLFFYHTGLYKRFFRQKAVVALFHRVDDRLKDNAISCGVSEFREYCRFFSKYFTVVSFAELLRRLQSGEDISRHIVITFDDGYRDNCETAAPILSEGNLPACFFVATGFVGSTTVPWWDEDIGVKKDWMDWNEIRKLRDQGFEIGSHTINHVDLGILQGDEAEREINQSKARLEAELNESCAYFSYPYGRLKQITEANRKLVRKAGYECCVSAYGGAVAPTTHPFFMKRAPISPWYISPYQFGFEAMFFEA